MDAPEDVPSDNLAELAPTWFRRRHPGRLRRGIAALTSGTAVYGLAAMLCIPPVIFLGAGIWSVITYTRTLFTLWDLLENWHLQAFLDGLSGTDLAVRMAIASGAYFALLFALIVIFSGLLGRRWQRLLVFPGLLLGVPALLVFLAGMQVATEAIASTLLLPDLLAPLAAIYALADLAVLAAFLTDLRPRLPRPSRRQRVASQANALLPLVRFGPPVLAATATDQLLYDETPSDPKMAVSVARALTESVPVAILSVTPGQREEAPLHSVVEITES